MNCDEFDRLAAAAAPLTEEALRHLRGCPVCSSLAALGRQGGELPGVAAAERRIVAAITADLKPVRPLAPAWMYVLGVTVAAGVAAAAGILGLGVRGWTADSLTQRVYFTACLVAGIAVGSVNLSRLMVPGAPPVLQPRVAAVLATLLPAAGAFLYPAAHDTRFLQTGMACLSIGLGHAALACGLMYRVVRRGALLSRPAVVSGLALLSALAGVAVLFVFCPHREMGHFSFGHSTVPVAALGLGAWVGRRLRPR